LLRGLREAELPGDGIEDLQSAFGHKFRRGERGEERGARSARDYGERVSDVFLLSPLVFPLSENQLVFNHVSGDLWYKTEP
jgi:hypothetical protein